MSDKGERDTKQVVENLMRLRNITSGVMCVKKTRATLTILKLLQIGLWSERTRKKTKQFYSELVLLREKN